MSKSQTPSSVRGADDEGDVQLPITRIGLEEFVEIVADAFDLPADDDCVAEGVATAIMHMPHDRAYAQSGYFGNCARKSLANRAAFELLEDLKQKRQAAFNAAVNAKKAEDDAKKTLNPPEQDTSDGQSLSNA